MIRRVTFVLSAMLTLLGGLAASASAQPTDTPNETVNINIQVSICDDFADGASVDCSGIDASEPQPSVNVLVNGEAYPGSPLPLEETSVGFRITVEAPIDSTLTLSVTDNIPAGYAPTEGYDPLIIAAADVPQGGCGGENACPVIDLILVADDTGSDNGTYGLSIMVRNCDSELIVFFTKPQEGCVPGDGAFFNVNSDSGDFLGNCEASINAANPAALYAGCVVQVPYGSTGVVTEDLASIPGYAPNGGNTRPFYAPPNPEPVDGEDYGPIFINVLQTSADDGSIPTDLPNTGAGPASISDGFEGMALIAALSGAATILGLAAFRVRDQS